MVLRGRGFVNFNGSGAGFDCESASPSGVSVRVAIADGRADCHDERVLKELAGLDESSASDFGSRGELDVAAVQRKTHPLQKTQRMATFGSKFVPSSRVALRP